MSRVQLALNVEDIEASVAFYSKLFGAQPAKREPGYANFAIADPPLKLVLVEVGAGRGNGIVGALNHLGVEVESPEQVRQADGRLSSLGLKVGAEDGVACCFAVQDKAWVSDPDGAPWEIYTVLADAPSESGVDGDGTCCSPTADLEMPVSVGTDQTVTSFCC